ncbi:hypothetical protein ABIB25_002007 [Nakamurella sp. UYEF19]|uniref:SRPBCC family protein n=1 Tax=Nakamurella sp. UYEF19 TaxID=1756392 RepID=UPI003393B993
MGILRPTFSISAAGLAPAALVWERYTRPALWSTWSPQIARVDCVDEVIRAGSTGVVHAIHPTLGLKIPFEVTDLDEASMDWAWNARLPLGVTLHLRHLVETVPGAESVPGVRGSSRTRLWVTGPAPIALGYLPVAQLALRALVRQG